MATYWKEVVNFEGEFEKVKLLLSVNNGEGVCEFDACGQLEKGEIQLLTREGVFFGDVENGVCKLPFQTSHREYCVQIRNGDVLLCGSGNSKDLRHEFAVPKINATDAFEERVADFNYYETELGERGKSLESILSKTPETHPAQSLAKSGEEKIAVEIKNLTNGIEEDKVEEKTKEETAIMEKTENEKTTPPQKSATIRRESVKSEPSKSDKSKSKPQSGQNGTSSKKTAKKGDFFSMAKPQVEKMLAKFPKEEFLEEVLDNSRWAKVDFSKDASYAVGIIYADDLVGYIGYAVAGSFDNPPRFENPQFVPFDIENPNGKGYFLIFQKADTGEKA